MQHSYHSRTTSSPASLRKNYSLEQAGGTSHAVPGLLVLVTTWKDSIKRTGMTETAGGERHHARDRRGP